MNAALQYLRDLEFSAGNGQCPECWGHDSECDAWIRQSKHLGHRRTCKLAKGIRSLGGRVVWKRANKSPEHAEFNERQRALYASVLKST